MVRKSLSTVNDQCKALRNDAGDLLHVLLVWLGCVLARPPYIYKVPLTTAVCCDHLVQMFTGLLSLPTSSSGKVLISGSSEVFMVPAFAPIGLIPALKNGELYRLGSASASSRERRNSCGMLGNAKEGAAKCVAKLGCLSESNAVSLSSGS
jgi:hypothetical protein